MNNPFSQLPLCPKCHDVRRCAEDHHARKTVPCDKCGTMSDEEYERFRRQRLAAILPWCPLGYETMTEEQRKLFDRLKAAHPHASNVAICTWVEGDSYDPSKDETFLRECNEGLETWRRRADIEVSV